MPYRTPGILVTGLGIVLVALLFFFRRDPRRVARSGPTWLRMPLVAGLSFLASIGFLPGVTFAADWVKNPYVVSSAPGELVNDPTGLKLVQTWNEADECTSGKRGEYPFDKAGKAKLLGDLKNGASLVDEMVAKKVVLPLEGELLKLDLLALENGIQGMRPTEMQMATCYEPMMPRDVQESYDRLSQRLPHLEKLMGKKLSPLVVEKVLARFQNDLNTLMRRSPEDVDAAKAGELETRIKKLIADWKDLGLTLPAPGLGQRRKTLGPGDL